MEATRAIILARVSTPEQEEGHSIDAQKHRLLEYCARKNLKVMKVFEIVESSTKGDRKKFMEMVQFANRYKEPIAIIADKVDRLQRSFREFPVLDELIQKGSIELHFYSENTIIHKDSRSSDRTMWSMRVLLAQSYTDATSDNIKRSLEHKRRQGEWCGPAPLGYLNERDDRDRSAIVVDPVRAPMLQRLFQEYATGAYTMGDMTRKAKEWGLRSKKGHHLTKSVIHRLLQQPFYYGEMDIKGERHIHCHKPLISRQLFLACEEVRLGYNKKPFRYGGKEFLFRGLITCATSGKIVTSDKKKKKYPSGRVDEWTYLMCWNPDKPEKKQWVREEKIIEQIEAVLNRLGFKDPGMLDDALDHIRETNKNKTAFHNDQLGRLKKEHTDIQKKLDRLLDLRLDGELSKEDFEAKKRQIKERQYEISQLLTSYDVDDDRFSKACSRMVELLSNAGEYWRGSNVNEKRELLNFVFSNLEMKGATLCYTLRKPIDEFLDIGSRPEWRRERDSNPR